MITTASVVDTISQDLSRRILRGELAPGARLPVVRALAREHEVNVSTIQRVLVRLEDQGLARVLPRSGVEVVDVARYGGTNLWSLVLEDARADPARAVELVRDVFETRRFLSIRVLQSLAARPFAEYGRELQARIDAFAVAVDARAHAPQELLVLEGEVFRTLLVAARRPAALGIFNAVFEMLAASTDLVAAFYEDPALNVAVWRSLAATLSEPSGSLPLGALEGAMVTLDERITLAFERRIRP